MIPDKADLPVLRSVSAYRFLDATGPRVLLEWGDVAAECRHFAHYQIECRIADTGSLVYSFPTKLCRMFFVNLPPGLSYLFRGRAVDDEENASAWVYFPTPVEDKEGCPNAPCHVIWTRVSADGSRAEVCVRCHKIIVGAGSEGKN